MWPRQEDLNARNGVMTSSQPAHNPEVAGSNPAPATEKALETGPFCFWGSDAGQRLLPNFCPQPGDSIRDPFQRQNSAEQSEESMTGFAADLL